MTHSETLATHASLVPPAPVAVSPASPEFPPAGAALPILPPPNPAAPGWSEKLPILVADDDDDDLFFVQRLLRKTGIDHPIKAFTDGTEVVNYLGARLACATHRHRIPGLLFLDLNMCGLGGFGFLEWAQQQKGLLPLTIVVLSNSNHPADVQRALELGAHRYLVKYPSLQTMTTIVRSVYPFTLA